MFNEYTYSTNQRFAVSRVAPELARCFFGYAGFCDDAMPKAVTSCLACGFAKASTPFQKETGT